jgi:hypothetical protein
MPIYYGAGRRFLGAAFCTNTGTWCALHLQSATIIEELLSYIVAMLFGSTLSDSTTSKTEVCHIILYVLVLSLISYMPVLTSSRGK